MPHIRTASVLACLLAIAIPSGASAGIIGLPGFEFTLVSPGVTADTLSGTRLGLVAASNGNYVTSGTHTGLSGSSDYSWDLLINPDPTIGGRFGITNLLGMAKRYDLSFLLPVGGAFAPALVTGHLGTIVTDSKGDGSALLSNLSWSGLVDGVATMGFTPADLSCGTAGCSSVSPTLYGGPLNYPVGVSSYIGTKLSFTLSAGDRVSISTFFDVAIPEPGTPVLVLAGMLPILLWKRSRLSSDT